MRTPSGAVPAPQASDAAAPEPRTVWAAPDGRTALVARDWADGYAPTYGVLARASAAEGVPWQAANAEQTWQLLEALACWLDERCGGRPSPVGRVGSE